MRVSLGGVGQLMFIEYILNTFVLGGEEDYRVIVS